MYVCVCNAITDRDVCTQAEDSGRTVAMIYRSLGKKPTCGKCVPLVRQLMRQVAELSHPEPMVAATR